MKMDSETPVTIVGAGLAGCEAAVILARQGFNVELLEMKPASFSPAHQLDGPAELVCSNSLKSDSLDTAHGLLKDEMRRLKSVVMQAAEIARVPAGTALAVDRAKFSGAVRAVIDDYAQIKYRPGVEVSDLPDGDVIIATGPLTSASLTEKLQAIIGDQADLYFYDALAPIIDAETIDRDIVFPASRWGKGQKDDYLNCPLNEEQYRAFVAALRAAPCTPLHNFEQAQYFEGCLPVEVLAERGDDTLAFGPMRPVGLEQDGARPFAVVQLRCENREKTAYNLVGFQTKLTQAAQKSVFRMIPGLEQVKFLRYGAIHRNLYLNAPKVLNETLGLVAQPRIKLAGQITGVEGYMESAAMGILAGLFVATEKSGQPVDFPPPETALGALYAHVRGLQATRPFEPMNIHFGLLPDTGMRGRKKRRQAAIERGLQAMKEWRPDSDKE
jgi:methylenetetrahydrofolate--tRNA-(uracil-5-)-methyltransferase